MDYENKMKWLDAIKEGNVSLVKEIIDSEFDMEATFFNRHALHELEHMDKEKENEAYEIVKLLIDRGINLEYKNNFLSTPLTNHKIIKKFPDITHLLINSGANIHHQDASGFTALMYAIFLNKKTIVDKLIHLGADINHVDKKGFTIAEIGDGAMKEIKYNSLKLLLNYKNKLNEKQKEILEKEKIRMLFK